MRRKDEVKKHYAEVIDKLFSDEAYLKDYLHFSGKFYKLESSELMLIYKQCPTRAMLTTFETWKKFNRHVKYGEKSIAVLCQNGNLKHFFDISQTSGTGIPYQLIVDKQMATDFLTYTNTRNNRALKTFSKSLDFFTESLLKERFDIIQNKLSIKECDQKRFRESMLSLVKNMVISRCEHRSGYRYQNNIVNCEAVKIVKSKEDFIKLLSLVHESAKDILQQMERTILNINAERSIKNGRDDTLQGGQQAVSKNLTGERDTVRTGRGNIYLQPSNDVHERPSGTYTARRTDTEIRTAVAGIYEGELPRGHSNAGRDVQMGNNSTANRQGSGGTLPNIIGTVSQKEPTSDRVERNNRMGENEKHGDRPSHNDGISASREVINNSLSAAVIPKGANFHITEMIIKAIYTALQGMGFNGGNVLEPSCGIGNFYGAMPQKVINNYFSDNPHMVLGKMENSYRDSTACFPLPYTDLKTQLTEAITHIKADFMVHEKAAEQNFKKGEILAPLGVQNFTFTFIDGKLYFKENEKMIESTEKGKRLERIKGLMDVRNVLKEIIEGQANSCTDAELAHLQDKLTVVYDNFVTQYGYISSSANSCFKDDDNYNILCSLEIENPLTKKIEKAGIFTSRTIKANVVTTHCDTN